MRRLRLWVRGVRAVVATGLAAVSLGDLLLVGGLALVVLAFWEISRPAALGIPGAVLIWYALPAREPFIRRARPDGRGGRG